MKPDHTTLLKPVGLLAFLATAAIGWNLAAPPAGAISRTTEEPELSKRAPRPSRSVAADSARNRISSLRAIADPEARLLATISLANSLSPEDFAAWMDGKWFTLRGGPEHLIFDRILRERWRNENPEGLLEWSVKNKNGAADGIMKDWAANQPQRLLDFFKVHRDDEREMGVLAQIAANSPQIALARLQEMIASGLMGRSESASNGVLQKLLETSPATLLDALGTLPPEMRLTVEGMMCRKRLDASFSEEIRSLWERPDGWKIFSKSGIDQATSDKLLGELANLPPEWRASLASSSWSVMNSGNAAKWFDADLEGAGFSPESAQAIRRQAMHSLAFQNPEEALTRLGEIDLEPIERKRLFEQAVNRFRDPEKLRALIPLMTNDEDRDSLTKKLESLSAAPQEMPATPGDFLELLGKLDAGRNSAFRYLSDLEKWDPPKILELTAQFKDLPGEKKQQVAQVIIASSGFNSDTSVLKGDALRYVIENPPPKKQSADSSNSLTAASGGYVMELSNQDPEAATAWVKALPPGEEKSWAQRNLLNHWKQYDPAASAAWEKSLPAAERAALEKTGFTHAR